MNASLRGKFLIGSLIGALALGLALDADAKRLGGSRSVGKQSSSVTQRQQTPPQNQPNQAQQAPAQQAAPAAAGAGAAAQAAPKRNWGGMLGGLAAGLGIAALLSHFGLAGAAASFISNLILVALVVFVGLWLFRKFRSRQSGQQPAYSAAGVGATRQEPSYAQTQPPAAPLARDAWQAPAAPVAAAAATTGAAPYGVPADFDTEAFLRNAKVYFVRLQAAWDASNLNDIREFTTPEMFGEIKMDLAERGQSANKTDVVTLEAELLGIESSASDYLASVRFSGMLRETEGAAAAPFAEVWNLSKPTQGSGGWLLAGIQQLQ
jgi:predicted lipid-binding transport protein (Tim44 family)